MNSLGVFLRARYGKGFSARADIEEHQKKAFLHLRKNIMPRSPFYKSFADKPLSDWPLMNKVLMMQHFSDINTAVITKDEALRIALACEEKRDFAPMIGKIAVGLSTGTSGQRGLFASNKRERALWAALMLGRFSPSFLRSQRVSFFLRANNMLYERLGNILISFEFYDLLRTFEEHLRRLTDQKPTVLIAPAQILGLLAKAQKDGVINIVPQCIISVAEVLSPEDKRYIENIFKVKVDQVYQCTEGVLGMTCKAGNLHLNEAYVHIERDILEPISGAFAPIITDLTRETLPILKYRLDDILIPDDAPCPCGCASQRLKRIDGRCDDILYWQKYDGKLQMIPSDVIRQSIATANTPVQDYRVIQYGQERLDIWLETDNLQQACRDIEYNLQTEAGKLHAHLPKLHFHQDIELQIDQKRRRVIFKKSSSAI
ncbi:F390 synthetase-related protein [Paenochrobactrum sp. BZR 588]|uniref:F390 synthetase-related protein n=1 Tax=unclassified Paenochrobactrum TaxID=2639760 RepID=UPI0038529E50